MPRKLVSNQSSTPEQPPVKTHASPTTPTRGAPTMPAFPPEHTTLIETLFEDRPNLVAELKELESELGFSDTHPEAIRAELVRCEFRALRAHRCEVLIKRDRERFKIDADVAIEAMREAAEAELTEEKLLGKRSKSITNADVAGRAATKYPDEWRDIHDRIETFDRFSQHVERLADLWQQRARTLAAALGGR